MKNKQEVHFLNVLLSDFFVLSVKLRRYHWYIQGKSFFLLHGVYEEMYDSFAQDIDKIAERIMMIGGKPYASMEKYLKFTTIEEVTADDLEEEMIEQLLADYKQITTAIKTEGIKYAEEQEDEPTLDMLISFLSKLEKYIWMLRAYHN